MKPILFSTPMVQAIQDGRKTVTRRIVKWPSTPDWHDWDYDPNVLEKPKDGSWWPHTHHVGFDKKGKYHNDGGPIKCPYGKPGDILWVRETWQHRLNDNGEPSGYYYYKADDNADENGIGWKPSIFIPYEACRLFLKVKSIRVERLNDISEADAIAEGVEQNRDGSWRDYIEPTRLWQDCAKPSFISLWMQINGKESWEANPWIWVVSFEKTFKP